MTALTFSSLTDGSRIVFSGGTSLADRLPGGVYIKYGRHAYAEFSAGWAQNVAADQSVVTQSNHEPPDLSGPPGWNIFRDRRAHEMRTLELLAALAPQDKGLTDPGPTYTEIWQYIQTKIIWPYRSEDLLKLALHGLIRLRLIICDEHGHHRITGAGIKRYLLDKG